MKYFDRNTNLDRIDPSVRPLVRGLLQNKQLFDEDTEDAPYVSEALKYRQDRQDRRQTSPYTGDNEFVRSILDIFEFDPLDFQVESWTLIDELEDARRRERKPHGAIFSAPTGFGKTEAFLGPLYQLLRDDRHRSSVVVYPRRALLQNQLERLLQHLHAMRGDGVSELSVGVYVGGMPYELSEVETNTTFFDTSAGRPRFRLASCWCGADGQSHSFQYHGSSREYVLKCEHDHEHSFTDQELVLSRREITDDPPDIILTTLESLELFALKPNYDIIDSVDSVVLDEVHLYTGLRGAHTAKIIENINDITDHPILWLGASATVDDPNRFARKLLNLPGSRIESMKPPDSDFKTDHDDREHYYFLMSPEDGPGASSMMIQQLMLLGHSLLVQADGQRGKILSFIDSISQVNQKHAQLVDADHRNELWRHHLTRDDEANWQTVADDMGYRFLDDHLSFLPVYSDAGFDADAAANSDVLLSTSFLEVGIDVGDISVVSQYRTPQDLSSFIQRTGRAAREEDMDSHVFVFLSNLTGDANMFYRADRFLGEELRTPLKPDNEVVEWIHGQLGRFYEVVSAVRDEQFRSPRREELAFFERYLKEAMDCSQFHRFLTDPGEYLDERLGIAGNLDQPLLAEGPVRTVESALRAKRDALDDEFEEIDEYIDVDGEQIVRSENAFEQYLGRIQRQILELVEGYRRRVENCEEILEAADDRSQEALIEAVRTDLENAREAVADYRGLSKDDRVNEYRDLLVDLATLGGQLMGLVTRANQHTDGEDGVEAVQFGLIDDLQEAVDLLGGLAGDERIERLSRQRKQIYYLRKAVEELANYRDLDTDEEYRNSKPYLSVYYVKYLLRSVYYFERFLNTNDESMGEVWYVPPSYFESSGQYLTVFYGENDRDGTEESIDSIVHSHAPYRSEYQQETGNIQVFMPETRVVEPGNEDEDSVVEFDFRDVPGDHRSGMLVPDSITTQTVSDLTDESARNIVQYCPQCLQILPPTGACLRHNDRAYGKIHSDPNVRTVVNERTVDDETGGLALCDLTGEVTLQGVTLNITPAEYAGSEYGYVWADRDRIEREIRSPDRPLGFTLDTRGLVYDVEGFVDSVDSSLVEQVATYKDLEAVEFEYLVYHTAAHFFLQLVSDIGGVNPSMLFYGLDRSRGEVFVFERTEGGQGIVDLVYEELSTDPGTVLEALNRVAYNPQVINERLWADPDVVDDLPTTDSLTEDEAERVVATHADVPYPTVRDRIVQEFITTADRAAQLSRDEVDVDLETAYEVKHTVALDRVDGSEEFPAAAVETVVDDEDVVESIESLFYSPDIDGCVENLHLSECISGHDQEESLSYVVLEALRESLVERVPTADAADRMFDHDRLPAAHIDDSNVFLTF